MTREHKLQAITKAIQEAVPDVMELKFGCKVVAEFYHLNPEIQDVWTETLTLNRDHQNSRWYHFIETDAQSETIVKILGSPIGIREVMLWIETKHNKDFYFSVHSNLPFGDSGFYEGKLVLHFQFKKSPSANVPYDLHKDTLEHQSDTTIDFLYSLTQS